MTNITTNGIASMEQMEQLLPRTMQDKFCNSCKSVEIFGWVMVMVMVILRSQNFFSGGAKYAVLGDVL